MVTVLVVKAGCVGVVTVVCGFWEEAQGQRQTQAKTATRTKMMKVAGTDTPRRTTIVLATEGCKMVHYKIFSSVIRLQA